MLLEAEISGSAPVPARLSDALRALLAFAASAEPRAPRGEWSMSLRLTDDAEIAELHARFFDDPSATDVISFPSGDDVQAPTGYLGDVVISLDTAGLNAEHEGHAAQREVAFLALHGLLHLCGYDDATARAREAMLARQTELLETYEHEYGRPW